jgi:dTDP-4-amino-4,6-dideoxygalactose transaminase
MEVRLLDLSRQWERIGEKVEAALADIFGKGAFILGRPVGDFEAQVAEYCGTEHAVGVASGTDALLLALRACGVEHGEEVITTPYTFFATAGAIWNVGGRPVFVDIDPATFNLDVERLQDAVTERTRVIMPVDLFGQVADMDGVLTVADRHGLKVIEDAAQAMGAEYHGKPSGGFGDLGAFSFFPSKNLGGAGDGGIVTGNDEALTDAVRLLRGHGARKGYIHEVVGWNSRLDAVQAAVLSVKLELLDEWCEDRRRHAAAYDEAFLPMDEVTPPVALDGCRHIYNQYVIRCRDRDRLKAFLAEQGVGTAIYYPRPLHLQECFASLSYGEGDFPEAERAAGETLSLPVYPELAEEEQAYVIEKVKEFYAG